MQSKSEAHKGVESREGILCLCLAEPFSFKVGECGLSLCEQCNLNSPQVQAVLVRMPGWVGSGSEALRSCRARGIHGGTSQSGKTSFKIKEDNVCTKLGKHQTGGRARISKPRGPNRLSCEFQD